MSNLESLNIAVLGDFAAFCGTRPVDIGPPRQRAILALLTVHTGHVVSTQKITEEIWGTAPPEHAAATLQTYVSRLRRILRGPRRGLGGNLVEHRAPGYLLALDRERIDAFRFEDEAAAGRIALREGDFELARKRLTGALELWQGTPFAEFAAYRFATDEADRLEQVRLTAVTGHAEAAIALGGHEAVIATLVDEVRNHPLHEPMVRQLMLALYRSGRQADALHAYEHTRRRLAEELGIDAGEELQHLYSAILRQDPSLKDADAGARPVTAAAQVRSAITHADRPVLAGREQELARLERATAATLTGAGRTIVVAGEDGIGKTRLLIELDGNLSTAGAIDVVWGSGVQVEGAPAHWMWVQVLRQLAALRPEAFGRMIAGSEALLAPLLPGYLSRPESPAPQSVYPAQARFRIHDELCRILVELATERPLAIVFDDLHWADRPSLELFRLLAGRIRHTPLLMVASTRDTAPDLSPALRETLGCVLRESYSETVQLRGISPEAVAQLAVALTGHEIPAALRAALHARTNGNPFLLTQLLSSLAQGGTGDGAEIGRLLLNHVPFGVREVLHHRLSKLDANTLALLRCCTVIGTEIPVSLLYSVFGADRPTHRYIEQAMRANLLRADPDRIDVLRFTHALVFDVLHEELTASERATLHRRVTEVLVERRTAAEEYIEQIAYHSWRAAAVLDTALVLERLAMAAERAERNLDYEQAEMWLRRAVELTRTAGAGAAVTAWERRLQTRLGQLLTITAGFADAEAGRAFSRAEDLSQEPADPDQPSVLLGLNLAQWAAGQYGTAAELAERLREIGRRTGNVIAVVGGAYGRGLVRYVQGDVRGALAEFAAAVHAADDLVQPYQVGELRRVFQYDPRVICRAYGAMCAWLLGDRTRAGQWLTQMETLTADSPPAERALFLYVDALVAVLAHDVERVWLSSAAALELTGTHELDYWGDMTVVLYGWAMAYRGRVDDGLALINEALGRLDRTRVEIRVPLNLGLLAMAQQRAGDLRSARATIDLMAEKIETRGEYVYFHPCMPFTDLREQFR
ncbi:BTAD domain-containing putative transcriptional regulator [Nocardia sp. NPDC088792]|uniref:BTAD domain-containing putative transcriptional regulator n=1 Tax=Nocardia sp. NPDC088792 TaxID=3364332 RepID=UPI00382D7399